jgi:putative spermidine/putrescine transport system substrate-binding protein
LVIYNKKPFKVFLFNKGRSKEMKKKLFFTLILLIISIGLIACQNTNKEETNVLEPDWDMLMEDAKGTTVNFYGWGGDPLINQWVDTYLASRLKEEYNIKLNRVPMNIDEILNRLLGEKQFETQKGSIDFLWINGENFFSAKENGLLFGPFTEKLPNFNQYIDGEDEEVKFDFGFSVEGYEAPYGKAQFILIYDEARLNNIPQSHEALLAFAKEHPGQFTYPAPPDFTGSAFIRNIIYDIVGYEQFVGMEPDKEKIKEVIEPAMDYLEALKPYLWREGKTYPASNAQVDNMFADYELLFTMSYHPNHAAAKIEKGEFPETSRSFVFDKGMIGNTHFLAIPFNAPNKAGALIAINFILSVEAQASKYNPENWGDLPVLDNSRLLPEEKQLFEEVKIGKGALSQDFLLSHRLPEMPANLIPIIEEIWLERIAKVGE